MLLRLPNFLRGAFWFDDAYEEQLNVQLSERADVIARVLDAPVEQDGVIEGNVLIGAFSDRVGNYVFLATSNKPKKLKLLTDAGIVEIEEPQNFKQARSSMEWREWYNSMAVEMDTFKNANAFRLVPLNSLPRGARIFKLVWKFKLKRNADHETA